MNRDLAGFGAAGHSDILNDPAERILTSAAEIAHLRAYMRDYILDYQARFEESRRHFFLIDLYPHNHVRFNLVVTPAGQGAQIAET